jgi:hypothetical protein
MLVSGSFTTLASIPNGFSFDAFEKSSGVESIYSFCE